MANFIQKLFSAIFGSDKKSPMINVQKNDFAASALKRSASTSDIKATTAEPAKQLDRSNSEPQLKSTAFSAIPSHKTPQQQEESAQRKFDRDILEARKIQGLRSQVRNYKPTEFHPEDNLANMKTRAELKQANKPIPSAEERLNDYTDRQLASLRKQLDESNRLDVQKEHQKLDGTIIQARKSLKAYKAELPKYSNESLQLLADQKTSTELKQDSQKIPTPSERLQTFQDQTLKAQKADLAKQEAEEKKLKSFVQRVGGTNKSSQIAGDATTPKSFVQALGREKSTQTVRDETPPKQIAGDTTKPKSVLQKLNDRFNKSQDSKGR